MQLCYRHGDIGQIASIINRVSPDEETEIKPEKNNCFNKR